MTEQPGVFIRVTKFEVSIWPDDLREQMSSALDAVTWAITVEERGPNRWAVLRGSACLGADGKWEYEPRPSERSADWLTSHRFPLEEAKALAARHAAGVTINGRTAVEILARHRPQD